MHSYRQWGCLHLNYSGDSNLPGTLIFRLKPEVFCGDITYDQLLQGQFAQSAGAVEYTDCTSAEG